LHSDYGKYTGTGNKKEPSLPFPAAQRNTPPIIMVLGHDSPPFKESTL